MVLQLQRCLSREIEAMRICSAEAPELANTTTEAETEEESAAANGVGVGVDAGVYESENLFLWSSVPLIAYSK